MVKPALASVALVLLAACASAPEVTPAVRSELAPAGKLRAGINYGNPLFAVKDANTGEGSGIAVDLARELGRRLGVSVAPLAETPSRVEIGGSM